MNPAIEDSIIKLSESRWLIGSLMICETDLTVPLHDVLGSWVGDEGRTFYLRKSLYPFLYTTEDVRRTSQIDRVHKAGTGAAVWAFGGAHVKVKAWIPELQSESDTIEYIRKTGIPAPEIVYSWIDSDWNRTFLVMKSIKGRTLCQAWPVLSQDQKSTIADQIAACCAELALSKSDRMETLGGKGVREDWLTSNPSPLEPSWKPNVQGPFTADLLKSYIGDASIDIGSTFHFYHADLGPSNIILDDDGHLVAIIDWESAAFYPRFWIATKPLFSAGFNLAGSDRSEWAFLLSNALERRGFKADADLYRSWRAAVTD